jgi:hypothetical protein
MISRHSEHGIPKTPPKEKDYFLEGVQFPVCHHFLLSYKNGVPIF